LACVSLRRRKGVTVPAELKKEVQGEPRLLEALEQIASLLVPGEAIEAWAVQRRFLALTHRRALIVATTGRLIDMKRGLFGGFQPRSVRWQDLKEARISIGILGASLTVSFFEGPDLAITGREDFRTFPGLRKTQAEAVYRVCQAQDQAWREKRRVRELEEMRARSGGIQLGTSGAGAGLASSPTGGQDDTVARLEKAKAMLDKGLISDAEFEALKARIVNTL
jgi:Short C-terminal domain